MQIAVGVAFKSMFSRIMRPLRTLVGLRDGTVCVLAEMASIRRYGIRNSSGELVVSWDLWDGFSCLMTTECSSVFRKFYEKYTIA